MKIERLQKLFEQEEASELEWKGKCHDCNKEIKVLIKLEEEGFNINGGAVYEPFSEEYKGEKKFFIKCEDCFVKDRVLRNYQGCEVYSRVVGYLRPVKQFNPGKKEEFKDRKDYILKEN